MALDDVFLWASVLAPLLVMGVALALPPTRPYVRKYWWAALAAAAALAVLTFRRRPAGSPLQDEGGGREIEEENLASLDNIVGAALERSTWADAELARKKLGSELVVDRMDAELAAAKQIEDSMERRKALLKVVEDYT